MPHRRPGTHRTPSPAPFSDIPSDFPISPDIALRTVSSNRRSFRCHPSQSWSQTTNSYDTCKSGPPPHPRPAPRPVRPRRREEWGGCSLRETRMSLAVTPDHTETLGSSGPGLGRTGEQRTFGDRFLDEGRVVDDWLSVRARTRTDPEDRG